MRRFLLFLAYGIIAVVLETTLFANFPTTLVHLDLILFAVVALALSEDQRGVIVTILMLGALMDVSSSAPFGLTIICSLAIYGFIRMVFTRIMVEAWVARFIWVGVASLLDKVVTGFLLFVWYGDTPLIGVLLKIALPQAFFDASLGLILVPLLRKYEALTWSKLFRPKKLIFK
jgi:rod shape-determining protein MreD